MSINTMRFAFNDEKLEREFYEMMNRVNKLFVPQDLVITGTVGRIYAVATVRGKYSNTFNTAINNYDSLTFAVEQNGRQGVQVKGGKQTEFEIEILRRIYERYNNSLQKLHNLLKLFNERLEDFDYSYTAVWYDTFSKL